MSNRLTGDFRKFMDKNYLGHWDVPEGDDLILTIDHAEQNDVKNERGSEKKLTIYFVERGYKPMILNTTNAERIEKAYGTGRVEEWPGKKVSIYTEMVSAFGGTKKALRIRDYPPRETEAICEDCRMPVVRHGDYSVNKIIERSRARWNKKLCWDCSMKRLEAENDSAE